MDNRNISEYLGDVIGVILDPRFWFRISSPNLEWDKILNEAMDKYTIEQGSGLGYTFHLGPFEIWGYPLAGFFAFGRSWSKGFGYRCGVPRRSTALRLKKLLNETHIASLRLK